MDLRDNEFVYGHSIWDRNTDQNWAENIFRSGNAAYQVRKAGDLIPGEMGIYDYQSGDWGTPVQTMGPDSYHTSDSFFFNGQSFQRLPDGRWAGYVDPVGDRENFWTEQGGWMIPAMAASFATLGLAASGAAAAGGATAVADPLVGLSAAELAANSALPAAIPAVADPLVGLTATELAANAALPVAGGGGLGLADWISPISTVISGGLDYLGTNAQADAIADATENASAQEMAMFQQALAALEPFRLTGVAADAAMRGYLGLPAPEDPAQGESYNLGKSLAANRPEFTPYQDWDSSGLGELPQAPELEKFSYGADDLSLDPGYQFRLKQGLDAIEQAAAARGRLFSGATGKELTEYGQGFASNEYDSAWNRAFQTNARNNAVSLDTFNTGMNRYQTNRSNSFSDWLTNYTKSNKDFQTQIGLADADLDRLMTLSGRGQTTATQIANLTADEGKTLADSTRYLGQVEGAQDASGYQSLADILKGLGTIYEARYPV